MEVLLLLFCFTDQGGDCRGNSKNGSSIEPPALTKLLGHANPAPHTSCAIFHFILTTVQQILLLSHLTDKKTEAYKITKLTQNFKMSKRVDLGLKFRVIQNRNYKSFFYFILSASYPFQHLFKITPNMTSSLVRNSVPEDSDLFFFSILDMGCSALHFQYFIINCLGYSDFLSSVKDQWKPVGRVFEMQIYSSGD